MTREQAAKILVNLANLLGIDTSDSASNMDFNDLDVASDWAKEYILQVSSLKTQNNESVMGGTSEKTFSPKSYYTTQQAVTTLVRIMDLT